MPALVCTVITRHENHTRILQIRVKREHLYVYKKRRLYEDPQGRRFSFE